MAQGPKDPPPALIGLKIVEKENVKLLKSFDKTIVKTNTFENEKEKLQRGIKMLQNEKNEGDKLKTSN